MKKKFLPVVSGRTTGYVFVTNKKKKAVFKRTAGFLFTAPDQGTTVFSFIQLLVISLSFAQAPLLSQSLFESALATPDSSSSMPVSFNGFTRSVLYMGQNQENDLYFQSLYSQFALSSEVNAGKYGKAYAEIHYRNGMEFDERISEFELREAYISAYIGPVTLTAGKQIFSWGAGSFVNPTDQSTPLNPVFRSPYSDDLKMGRWTFQFKLQANSQSSLEATWFPYHQPSVLLTGPFVFPDDISIQPFKYKLLTPANSSFRLNYDLRSSLFDLGLSFYNGYRNNPLLLRDTLLINMSSMELEQLEILQQPYRISNAGFQLGIPFGSYLFRTEAAWISLGKNEEITTLPFDELSYIAELEQSGQNVTIIAGYHGKYILDFEKGNTEGLTIAGELPSPSEIFPPGSTPDLQMLHSYIDDELTGFNRLYNYQAKEFYHTAYINVTFSLFFDQLEFDIPAMYNFTSEEFTIVPSIAYNITDGLTLQGGAYLLRGSENSIYELVEPVLNAGYILLNLNF